MNFEQYMNQEVVAKQTDVVLSEFDFKEIPVSGKYRVIEIPVLGYTYIVPEGTCRLWSMDDKGYPKTRSIFVLPEWLNTQPGNRQ